MMHCTMQSYIKQIGEASPVDKEKRRYSFKSPFFQPFYRPLAASLLYRAMSL
jgi:hypothetical protein